MLNKSISLALFIRTDSTMHGLMTGSVFYGIDIFPHRNSFYIDIVFFFLPFVPILIESEVTSNALWATESVRFKSIDTYTFTIDGCMRSCVCVCVRIRHEPDSNSSENNLEYIQHALYIYNFHNERAA